MQATMAKWQSSPTDRVLGLLCHGLVGCLPGPCLISGLPLGLLSLTLVLRRPRATDQEARPRELGLPNDHVARWQRSVSQSVSWGLVKVWGQPGSESDPRFGV